MKNLIAVAVLIVGIIFLSINGVWAEDDPRVANLKKWCEEGNGAACFQMGERYRTVELDNKTAIVYHLKACDAGYITGCNHAGILLMGIGTHGSKEWKQAGKLFKKGCDIDTDKACYNLGSLKFKEGRQKASLKYWKKSCDLGNASGCFRYKKYSK